jgi:hypothetical protein
MGQSKHFKIIPLRFILNKLIKRLVKFKKPDEFMCLVNRNHKFNGWYENFTKTGEHSKYGDYQLIHKDMSNYIQLNISDKERRGRDDISNANGFFFDFDEGEIEELVARVETLLGKPTFKILTTPSKGKIQMLYLFDKRENRFDLWEKLSYSLTVWAGSDSQVWDLPRVFRNPYSINGKNGEQCQLLEDSGIENSMDYFAEKISENDIPLLDIPAIRPKPAKPTKLKGTTKKAKTKKVKVVKPLNKEASEYQRYEDFLAKTKSPSEARYSIVLSMIARRFNNKKILTECDTLGLDMDDIRRIMEKKGRI